MNKTSMVNELLLRHPPFVVDSYEAGHFKLAFRQTVADLYVEKNDFSGVARAVGNLGVDLQRVSGLRAEIKNDPDQLDRAAVIVGTIGRCQVIDDLIASGRLDVGDVRGKWESYVIQVIAEPVPGVESGLIIAGSDGRGAIYGVYELSRQIGVSPWYWWADVTPEKKDNLVVKKGTYIGEEPSVKYRGIFLNNEAPSLSTWVQRFGGFNHKFYEKIFELILRLRGNFLWPAMWSPKSFFRDDPLNQRLGHEYGIVIGTSHHEPMMRSWGEWGRFGSGEWNYSTNKQNLLQFWEDGIEWAKDYEQIVTVGMRGDGDEPMMHDGTTEEMVATMENIIADQRKILAEKINSDVTQVPQAWALYKEVQDLYEAGLDVPEDVTILLGNDNFGNIRLLPHGEERNHAGSFGMYYHFDYVGGPKSYRWVNSTPNHKIWEQMNMTYDYGVDRIWVVNVGDLKLHEVATEFFLEMAYDVSRWHKDNLADFSLEWAKREFGEEYAAEIAEIADTYRKFTGRKKSEDLNPFTYSLLNYKEAETVLAEFEEITIRAEEIYKLLPEEKKDAFYQLVLYPTRASKNVAKINIYAGLNNLYAKRGSLAANLYADLAEQAFQREAADTDYFNNVLADGKWRGINSNPHIGQKGWRMPERNMMPEIHRLPKEAGSELGIALEGSEIALTADFADEANLPTFSVLTKERHYLDVFNFKTDPFTIVVKSEQPWIKIHLEDTTVAWQTRVWVELDWASAPQGEKIEGALTIAGAGETIVVPIAAHNPPLEKFNKLGPMTFIESNGYISIEAEHYGKNKAVDEFKWEKIDNYGRTLSSMAVFPTLGPVRDPANSPCLEYKVYITTPGDVAVTVYSAPTNNINRKRGLCYGIAFDEQQSQIVDTFPKENDAFYTSPLWSRGVMENIRLTTTQHRLEAGVHTLKIKMIDPGVVLQKIVIDTGGAKPSYLGPPESHYVGGRGRVGQDKDGYLQLLAAVDWAEGLLAKADSAPLQEAIFRAKQLLAKRAAALSERLIMLRMLNNILQDFVK